MEAIKITVPILSPSPSITEEEIYKNNLKPIRDNIEINDHVRTLLANTEIEKLVDRLMPKHPGNVWEVSLLGFDSEPGRAPRFFSFKKIEQDWLRCLAKLHVKYISAGLKQCTVRATLDAIIQFSKYLNEHHKFCTSPEYLRRDVILGYVDSMKTSNLSQNTINHRLIFLRTFLQTAETNGWLSVPDGLISAISITAPKKSIPNYIPESVLAQLNQHLDYLPDPLMRMLLVMQECGMRGGELIGLKLNCIHQDHSGDWFIGFDRKKVNAEHRIPISKQLAIVIQQQQAFIKEHLPGFEFLFCSNGKTAGATWQRPESHIKLPKFIPVPRQMLVVKLAQYLNKLAVKCNITDESGELWHFHGHQFRHTVATRMINNKVPIHIVQRYLGHASPSMTLVYANIHDQTMKEEFLTYHSRVVTITGDVVKETTAIDGVGELAWLRKNILPQALPNGSCARPIVKGPCPHANACLTCGDFRTTAEFLEQHHAQLNETENIISHAKANGWNRQVEMNETVAVNLRTMIESLTEEGQSVGA